MTKKKAYENIAKNLAALGRDELRRRIRNFKGRFHLDFTEEYLDALNDDRLRHILLAAYVTEPQGNPTKQLFSAGQKER